MGRGLTSAITVVVVDRDTRTVDRQLLEVGAVVTVELGIEVGEDTALEEWVICEVDTAHDVSRLELQRGQRLESHSRVRVPTMTCSVSAK